MYRLSLPATAFPALIGPHATSSSATVARSGMKPGPLCQGPAGPEKKGASRASSGALFAEIMARVTCHRPRISGPAPFTAPVAAAPGLAPLEAIRPRRAEASRGSLAGMRRRTACLPDVAWWSAAVSGNCPHENCDGPYPGSFYAPCPVRLSFVSCHPTSRGSPRYRLTAPGTLKAPPRVFLGPGHPVSLFGRGAALPGRVGNRPQEGGARSCHGRV